MICASATSRSISSSSSRRKESPLENLRRAGAAAAARAPEQELRDFLAGFGFRGDRVFEPVAPFSGGEKARLVLASSLTCDPICCCSMSRPTIWIWKCVRRWRLPCRIMLAPWCWCRTTGILLRTVADEFYIVHQGRAGAFDGDLEDYAKWLAAADGRQPPGTQSAR